MQKAFSGYPLVHGFHVELDKKFPSFMQSWFSGLSCLLGVEGGTTFGYVYSSEITLFYKGRTHRLQHGQCFSVPGEFRVAGGSGVAITRRDFTGVFSLWGEIEFEGRLKYIDGCTDSLLIPPVVYGDPCLNLLYFPEGVDQTAHTHPSDRIGMVLSGRGVCHAWNDGVEERVDLVQGQLFCIHAEGLHKFSTLGGSHMRVLAYHPESDFGPRNDEHPMINRTMIDGVSAAVLSHLQTK